MFLICIKKWLFVVGSVIVAISIFTACGYRPHVPTRPTPAILPELPPISMMATNIHTIAVGVDGTLWSEGGNESGQLGCGTTLARDFFDQVGADTDWASIATGRSHTVAIKTDGSLWAWGGNWNGQLGNSTRSSRSYHHVHVPTQVGADTDWAMVAAGSGHTVAVKTDGSLWAWGGNTSGQLGNGKGGDVDTGSYVPVQIGTDTDWAYVFAHGWYTMAIKIDGSLWAWGSNTGGLGIGTTEMKLTPTRVGGETSWVSVAMGSSHTVAIQEDGSLWAWGENFNGQLGDGTTRFRDYPVQIGTDTDWVSVAIGNFYTIATKEDGSLWISGRITGIGIGPAGRDATIPTQIYTDRQWASVAAGRNRAFAITPDGNFQRLGTVGH